MSDFIPIDQIIINRDERQRSELLDIESLAASIKRRGRLIHPIVLRDGNILVAGERRLAAHKLLGWDKIEYRMFSDLSPAEAHAIELEENIKRRDLSWKDECRAMWDYHQLRVRENPEQTQEQTAEELAISRPALTEHLMVQEEINRGNDLVVAADKFSVAKNIASRQRERNAASVDEIISAAIFPERGIDPDPLLAAQPKLGSSTTAAQTSVESVDAITHAPAPILNADFIEWTAEYSGPRFNFIHCDFPYGVNADRHHQGAAKYFRGYADSPDIYWQLVSVLGDNIDRLCADSAHLMFWFSMDFYTETKLALEQIGWRVNSFPLIWYKSDNTGILPDPARGPRRVYETAFICSRGDRKIVQPVANTFPAPVTKAVHMSEKSRPMLQHFFRMFVDEHTVMLDPTCGSANALQAADMMGAKSVLGLEKDPEFYARAVEAWGAYENTLDIQLGLDI